MGWGGLRRANCMRGKWFQTTESAPVNRGSALVDPDEALSLGLKEAGGGGAVALCGRRTWIAAPDHRLGLQPNPAWPVGSIWLDLVDTYSLRSTTSLSA